MIGSQMTAKTPSRFVGLHNHTGFSPFDGLGYPDEHFKWCIENGIDAHAITEHGNMNSYAHAQLWVESWNKSAKTPFKYIPGVESYFHPNLAQWLRDKQLAEQAKEDKAAAKKLMKQQEKLQTKVIAITDEADETLDIEMSNALTIENEDESKSTKHFNPINRRHHLVLLPKNQAGLLKIFGAVSYGYLKGFYRFPRIDGPSLKEAAKGGDIVVTSACIGGQPAYNAFQELQQHKFDSLDQSLLDGGALLERCVAAVGNCYDEMTSYVGEGNYFLELQFNRLPAQNLVNRAILEFARRSGVERQLIVTCDAHYARPELWKERELYKKLGFMNYAAYSPDSLPRSRDDLKCELYPKNASQVWDEYLKAKEGTNFYDDEVICAAIERTHEIAHNVIGEVPPDRSPKFPHKLTPPEKSPIQHLITLCKEGLIKRGLSDKPEYIERLKEELAVIKEMKNAEYFISYQKIIELARAVCLVGPGRGSGGGSLVNYVLFITDLDPLKWDLPFARFLNVHRQGAPDIDTDLADRDKVLDQLRNFFGFENVVPISNYNTFKLKTLVKDIGKFYGISFDETNAATRSVEEEVRKATMREGDDKNLFVLTFDEAMAFHCKHQPVTEKSICQGCHDDCVKPVSPSFRGFIETYPVVAESIKILFKQNRSLGRHAGGVLICDDLPEKMPLVASKGEPQSPWVEGVNFKHLEYIGNFIKYDLLGLETLRIIEKTIERILVKLGNPQPTFKDISDWFMANMHPSVIDFDDQRVYEYVYHDARWAGIFQCTGRGAQQLFKKAKPKNIIDIATLTSIYRPGPLAAHVDKLWLQARAGETQFDWGDDRISQILKKTDGLIIFQEQVMELAEKCAGFPKEQCDQVRRAIMKRSISGGDAAKKKANETRDSFVAGCVKNGYAEKVANNLYDKILYFAGYGFNKAHAVAYAIDSYYCAWLMTHHEEDWLAAYLETMSTSPLKKAKAFGEVRALGYDIVPIDINYATSNWRALPGKKFMPSLLSCKFVGAPAIEEITQNRPYETIEDLLWDEEGKWKHSKFNRRGLEALIKIGAFDSMEIVGKDCLFESYKQMHMCLIESGNEIKKSSKKEPFAGRTNFYCLVGDSRGCGEWSKPELAQFKVEYLGSLDVSGLVPRHILKKFDDKDVKPIDAMELGSDVCWFVVLGAKEKKTKNGKTYTLIDAAGPNGKKINLRVWGAKDPTAYPTYAVCLAEVEKNDFGCSSTAWKVKILS